MYTRVFIEIPCPLYILSIMFTLEDVMSNRSQILTRADEDPEFYSTDPDPAQLKKNPDPTLIRNEKKRIFMF